MSWMQMLYDAYKACQASAGDVSADGAGRPLPASHTLLKAHITATLDSEGNLLRARVEEDKRGTPSLCTENSESRTGEIPSHPLFDKLKYLAGDYARFTGGDSSNAYQHYIAQLSAWCDSGLAHEMVVAIRAYLQKGRLIEDLMAKGVLCRDACGLLATSWPDKKTKPPAIFEIKNINVPDAYVRFEVEGFGLESRVWQVREVGERFLRYAESTESEKRICYVSGAKAPYAVKHPKKIVSNLANAKLISSNDTENFSFRGRFREGIDAVAVSKDVSQKAHAMLRWLAETRGLRCGSQTIVVFGADTGNALPSPIADTPSLFSDDTELPDMQAATVVEYAKRFNAAALGYGAKHHLLDQHAPVAVIALDSASESSLSGRLSISMYRELPRGEYIERLSAWHRTCVWRHTCVTNRPFTGAPALRDIAEAAYGARVDDKLRKEVIERLLPCVLDGAPIPADIVNAAVYRASQPEGFAADKSGDAWNRCLSIACALYKKRHEREGFDLALETDRTDRDYLYGRLLAVADWVEQTVLRENSEKRQTNAMRLMSAFSQRPFRIWPVIAEQIRPYIGKIEEKTWGLEYRELIDSICGQFKSGDFEENKRLNGSYLLGFHCQRQVFIDKRNAAYERRNAEKTVNTNEEGQKA